MNASPLCLILEAETPEHVLQAALRICKPDQPPRLRLLSHAPLPASLRSGLRLCWQSLGGQGEPDIAAISPEAAPDEIQSPWLPLPSSLQRVKVTSDGQESGESDWELGFSDALADFCQRFAQAGKPCDEATLEAMAAHVQTPETPARALSQTLAYGLAQWQEVVQTWLTIGNASHQDPEVLARHWQGELGQRTRAVAAQALWRERSLTAERGPLEIAIRRVMARPDDWAARIVLLLYRRDLTGREPEPGWYRAAAAALTGSERLIEILQPAKADCLTIILPTYNRLPRLERAVASVLAQSSPDWRLLIGDDGSSDGTAEYLRKLAATDDRIEVFHNPVNMGCVGTMAALMPRCRTQLAHFYADDHVLAPEMVATMLGFYRATPWVGCVGSSWCTVDEAGQIHTRYGPYYPVACVADERRELQRHAMIPPLGPSSVYRIDLLRPLAPEDTWFCPGGEGYAVWDYLVCTRLLGRYEFGYLPDRLLQMIVADHTMSATRDNGYDLMHLHRGLLEDYAALFGPGRFPAVLAQYLIQLRRLELINHFQKHLTHAGSDPELQTRLQAHAPSYAAWYALIETATRESSPHEPLLIAYDNPCFGSLPQPPL